MRVELAEKLLVKVMGWNAEEISKYRPEIDILAQLKYDEYQQYFPGLRFIESLATWLDSIDQEDRPILFEFIIKRLLFISAREMNELVSQAFPDFIRPILFKSVAFQIGCSQHEVKKIFESDNYKVQLRKTLFLGLSDGARTDVLRRFNPFISHEQVLPFYLIPEEKHEELQEKLETDLRSIIDEKNHLFSNKFSTLVLLDDFTASGTSYFKYIDSEDTFKGKLKKILDKLNNDQSVGKIFDLNNLNLILIIYISTNKAKTVINKAIEEWQQQSSKYKFNLIFETVYLIDDSINITTGETKLCEVLKKYYDPSIETDSYKNGKHDEPYLGFDECGLPLILSHNTPNNSVTILWNERFDSIDDGRVIGLFPRVSRHKK